MRNARSRLNRKFAILDSQLAIRNWQTLGPLGLKTVVTEKVRRDINKKSINYITLVIFAPLLILVGILGFLIPAEQSLTSGAPAYNVFHLFFGLVGLVAVWSRQELFISAFNAGFGLIDLYQALASYLGLPPEKYFLWTTVDDILHTILGLILAIIGFYGLLKNPTVRSPSR